jgi:hypothetical protein
MSTTLIHTADWGSATVSSGEATLEGFRLALISLGGTAGNGTLRSTLGWSEDDYQRIKDEAVGAGLIELGRGRGGSVRLIEG